MKIKKQPFGKKIIIYIEGENKAKTEEKYYWFWHYGIASLSLSSDRVDWVSDNAIRFFTTPEKFVTGTALARLFFLIDNHPEKHKGQRLGAMPEAREYAQKELDSIEWTTGYKAKRGAWNFYGYDQGHGKAENLSDVNA